MVLHLNVRKHFALSFIQQSWINYSSLLLLFLTSVSLSAHADNTYFGIHGPSYHDGGNYNNANYGVYLVHQGFTGGFYENSLNRNTFYLGYAWEWVLPVNPLIDSVSLMGSLATGYYTEQTPYEYSPMGAISFKHDINSEQGLRLSYLPSYGKSPANYVLHLSYEYTLK
jgi:hypothetical protein